MHSFEENDFMPVIPLDYIRDTEEREAAEKLVCAMRPHLIELVDERLWLEWATLKSILKYSEKTEEERFEQFVEEEYFRIIGVVEEEARAMAFQPLYAVNVGDVDDLTQVKRQ